MPSHQRLARSFARVEVHHQFVPHPSVCSPRTALSLSSQQPMMSSQLCSSSPRNPEAFRRLFRRVLTDVLQRGVFDGPLQLFVFISRFTAAFHAPTARGRGSGHFFVGQHRQAVVRTPSHTARLSHRFWIQCHVLYLVFLESLYDCLKLEDVRSDPGYRVPSQEAVGTVFTVRPGNQQTSLRTDTITRPLSCFFNSV